MVSFPAMKFTKLLVIMMNSGNSKLGFVNYGLVNFTISGFLVGTISRKFPEDSIKYMICLS